jgi:capsid protein
MNKPKQNLSLLDKVVRYVSPTAFNKRLISRAQAEILARQYDAAQNYSQSPIKKNSKGARTEIGNAIAPIRNNARELIRNTPFAKKGLDVIVNGVVGYGISASITHQDKAKEEKIKALWKDWSQGLCSIDGRTDFYTLQNQVMAAIVSDGEVILKEADQVDVYIKVTDKVSEGYYNKHPDKVVLKK